MFNITDSNRFLTFYTNTNNLEKVHTITLNTGLLTTDQILADLQNKFNSTLNIPSNHLEMQASLIDQENRIALVRIKQVAATPANDIFFLGFLQTSVLTMLGLESLRYSNTNLNQHPLRGRYPIEGEPYYFRANHPSTIENDHGIIICSDNLSYGNTLEAKLDGQHGCIGKKTNILEFITFDAGKYNYINYTMGNNTHWHNLHGKDISTVDITIKDHHGHTYKWNEIPDYNIVLQFECHLPHDNMQQVQKKYDMEGYKLAHTAQNIMF